MLSMQQVMLTMISSRQQWQPLNSNQQLWIGEDTDLLVLLLCHSNPQRKDLYKAKSQNRVYNIIDTKKVLGAELCTHYLFVRAYTGRESTSQIFNVGKKLLLQKLMKGDTVMKDCAVAFTEPGKKREEIECFGRKVMVLLFGGDISDTLASMRHSILTKKVVSATSFVTPERLPPTESATKFYSWRVYYQVMTWLGKDEDLDATDWGWKTEANQFDPVMTDKNAAPKHLLKVVHCNCTDCSTQRRTCRGYGLLCTSACGRCQLNTRYSPYDYLPGEDDNDDSDDN